jgi:hypothetical protein
LGAFPVCWRIESAGISSIAEDLDEPAPGNIVSKVLTNTGRAIGDTCHPSYGFADGIG